MKAVRSHRPGEPLDPEPPEKLIELTESVADPLVSQCGVTTTTDGRWALYVTVPKNAQVPIENVEKQAGNFPVVYQAEPDEPPIAAPAYPAGGRNGPKKRRSNSHG